MLNPHAEYTIPKLAEETGVSADVLKRAIKRRELSAIKGPGGRGGQWRVLGQRYMDWQLARHRQAQQQPQRNTAVEAAQARVNAIFRGETKVI